MSRTRPDTYGRPPAGSQTEARGRKAHERLSNEILELCDFIEREGRRRSGGDGWEITFKGVFPVMINA